MSESINALLAELYLKKTKAAIFLADKESVEARKAGAEVAKETKDAEKAWLEAVALLLVLGHQL